MNSLYAGLFGKLRSYKKLIVFGAGVTFKSFAVGGGKDLTDRIAFCVSNNTDQHGQTILYNDKKITVYSIEKVLEERKEDICIIILVKYPWQIIDQLSADRRFREYDYISSEEIEFVRREDSANEKELLFPLKQVEERLIPKVIHYCWFGNNLIPEKYKVYIDSWKKFCPDYEIKLWNEDNFDISSNRFMKDAYDAGDYAFVSDYARLDIIYRHGGIYLDTDVELIKNLDDLLYQKMFAGFESDEYVAFGLGFGAVKGHKVIKAIMDEYEVIEYKKDKVIPCPQHQTRVLKRFGLVTNGEHQILKDITIYPAKMFCPKNYDTWHTVIKDYTHSIHHFDATWFDEDQRKRGEKRVERMKSVMEWIEKGSLKK